MDNRPIGVMDSGIGGLTAVKALQQQLPNESIEFVGDQARLPYGVRSSEEIQLFSTQIAQFLLHRDIKLLIIACNTATAAALPYLQNSLPIPVIGVIEPGSEAALRLPAHKVIGVIGTKKTIEDQAYSDTIHRLDSSVKVIGLACQEFVTLVEDDLAGSQQAQEEVADKLTFFDGQNVDVLILGCTHFPLLEDEISNVMGTRVPLIDAGAATIRNVEDLLVRKNMLAQPNKGTAHFYTTGNPEKFNEVASKWLNNEHLKIEKIELGD
ncbi:glutamate racemase [Paucilactobacillus kaifaensis]|uniref:glutamate racemase n=1 Tax=Paucilactobacillus kaifaensis TaxID=2559921 RepID=UPI0010F52AF9|nr:glutamate racemase [Paucilactobacillus kaifaensis]